MSDSEIKDFINKQNSLSTLRYITCGSVDDGKSTLLGRMLYEAQLIFDDQIDSLIKDSKKIGTQGDKIDFALLVDGLAAEREQGITIDVAYRFFSTKKRKFIVADSPGHEQYTRNMVTAASNAELAIILIDARNGIMPQTKRHSYIANLLGIKNIIVAINKMDLVNYEQDVYNKTLQDYKELKEAAMKIWDHHHEFKDDDRKLKKQILSHYNVLKQKVDQEVKEFNRKNLETKDLSQGYFDTLSEEISNLPVPKYYDESINTISKDIKKLNNHHDYNTTNISELYRIVKDLKAKQEEFKVELDEQGTLLADPPNVKNNDPLTPIDQKFVTLEQLQKHYSLFVERVQ